MPFESTVFSVLFTGPSDTGDLVQAGIDEVHRWNDQRAKDSGFVLLPQHYSRNAVSLFYDGADGQAVINHQLVDDADIVISLFRSRLGTATPRAASGTAEEIHRSIRGGTRLHVYFDDGHKPDLRDDEAHAQWKALDAFRRELRQGLWSSATDEHQLRDLIRRALEEDVRVLRSRGAGGNPRSTPPAARTAPPLELEVAVGGGGGHFADADLTAERYISTQAARVRERWKEARDTRRIPTPLSGNLLTEPELDAALSAWAATVRSSWQKGLEYIAGWSFQRPTFNLAQRGDKHVKDLRIDLTFEGVVGVPYQPGRRFDPRKLLVTPPEVHAPGFMVTPAPDLLDLMHDPDFHLQLRDDPVEWRNDKHGLVVTIELDRLRPHTPWLDEHSNLVLVVPEPPAADSVTVTWVASADGVDGLIEGKFSLPVRRTDVATSIQSARALVDE